MADTTNNPAFTPGPWKAALWDNREGFAVYSTEGLITSLQYDHGVTDETRDMCDANALLIAAAPDLYAALEGLMEWCRSESQSGAYFIAQQALSAARGTR